MTTNSSNPLPSSPAVRLFGVGDTGISVLNLLIADGISSEHSVAVNSGGGALEQSAAAHKVRLENSRLRGLGSGGDPERGRQAAEERRDELKALCQGAEVVFILAGLGGGSGTGIGPVLARIAKEAGAVVLGFVTTPFDCEGTRREALADQGLEELRDTADGLVCLPNQKVFRLIEENTSVVDTFKIADRLLADGVHGIWRLWNFKGLIEIHRDELCRLLHNRSADSAFAVGESAGADRARAAIDKVLAHPLLEDGEALAHCESVLVSLTGGPNLTISEVDRVMEQIKAKCGSAEVMLGACIDEHFGDRLAVAVITSKKTELDVAPRGRCDGLDTQLLDRASTAKPNSRLLPPPPALGPEELQKLMSRQARGRSAVRKVSSKMRQAQLPLEIVSKGRFDKSEPTIHKGEDLDVPTYIRRGVPLN